MKPERVATKGGATEAAGSGVVFRNRAFFESAAGAALSAARRNDAERAMQWALLAAECAWIMHPGFYTHPPLEAMLHALGRGLQGEAPEKAPVLPQGGNGRRCLHLLTVAGTIGGHSRFAGRMILNAAAVDGSRHCVMLIDQGEAEIPGWLGDAARRSGGELVALPRELGLADRARLVRRTARAWADIVFLHVHPSDPVPAVAFAGSDLPPVVFVNHADHVFWLGTACSDLVADIRPEGAELTRKRRCGLPSLLLPIPLDLAAQHVPRAKARHALGIAQDEVALVAVASAYKFAPYGAHDFPALASEMLARHEKAVLLLVGPAEDDPFFRDAAKRCRGRLRLFGPRQDSALFHAAADVCLESFPFGSLTSTLEAMLHGVPVHRAPAGVPLFFLTQYQGLLQPARDSEEYLQQAARYIEDARFRQEGGAAQREGVLQVHTGSGWSKTWERLPARLREEKPSGAGAAPAGWDAPQRQDLTWAELQQRQDQIRPDAETFYKHRVRAMVRGLPRGGIARSWLEALQRRDARLVRILFRNLTQLI